MKLFKKQTLLFFTILSTFCLPLVAKQNIKSVEEELPAAAPFNPNMHAYPCYSFETEPNYSTQNTWTFDAMGLGNATSSYTGKNVKLAIIDSGINYSHQDFINAGVNVVDSHSMSIEWENSKWNLYTKANGYESHLNDTNGHGTNVAACVASQINGVGGSGIAPDVDLYIFNAQGYQLGAIQTALNQCVSLGVDIVNMSIQAYEHDVVYDGVNHPASYDSSSAYSLESYINSCYSHGITVVAAAGNYNTSEPSYPASHDHVISVGSLAKSSSTSKASYSNLYGIDVVTSGSVYVASNTSTSSYKETQGTSFSSPLVAAAIALYKEKNPSATPTQIETALKNTCDPISGNPAWAGSGRINVDRFLGLQSDEPTEIVINNPEVVDGELELEVGEYLDLDWTVNGTGTFDDSVNFYTLSGDSNVVSVSSTGRITAVGQGTDYVVVECNSFSNIYADIYVTVTSSGGAPTVSSVTVSPSSLSLDLNGTKTGNLSATVNGDNNPSQVVSWSSSNTSIATVSASGVVTGVATGTATITATSQQDSSQSGTCTVTVVSTGGATDSTQYSLITSTDDLEVGKSYLITSGTTGTVKAMSKSSNTNNRPTTDLTVSNSKLTRGSNALSVTLGGTSGAYTFKTDNYEGTAGYFNATSTTGSNYLQIVSSLDKYAYFTVTFSNSQAVITCTGKTSRNILRYNSGSPALFACYSSGQNPVYLWKEVTTKTLTSISISTPPTKTSYTAGEFFNPSGLVITRTYSDSTSDTYSYADHTSEFTFNPSLSTALTTSNVSVSITYNSKSCNQAITVKSLSSISISGYTTSFVEGDTFSYGGTVTAHYSDNSSANVTSSATFTGYDMTSPGNQTVTVSYGGQSKTYGITVSKGTLSSISVSGMTTVYTKNAAFSFDGTCTATFANGYQKVVIPTSVTSPDMSSGGNKTITVSYTYNGNTRTTSYDITVNAYRTVMEASDVEGQITWSSSTATISGSVTGLSASTSGKTAYESNSMRLGTSNGGGTLNISASVAIYKVKISAKYYSSTYSSAVLKVDGQSVTPLTSSYADYTVTLSSAKTSFSILTQNSNSRINIQRVTVYSAGPEVDIGESEDCVGLETFINAYMHMDYTQNLGYCKDDEHHYYSTAKSAFNALNSHQRTLFTSNSAYLVEWTRLSTWASKNGDNLNSSNFLAAGNFKYSPIHIENMTTIIVVIITSGVTLSLTFGYFLFKRKKKKC